MATRKRERQDRLRYQLWLQQSNRTAPGIEPVQVRDVLAAEAAKPLRGGAADLQHNGLFGDSHKQTSLF